MSNLKDWFQGHKDASVSLVLEKMLQKKLERYGRLLELKIDSRRNTAFVRLLLKGETETVFVSIDEYEVSRNPSGCSVLLKRARASREWLTLLLEDYMISRPWPIPEPYASYAKLVL